MDTINNIQLGPKASDHLHATISIVLGFFVGMVLPYVTTIIKFNAQRDSTDLGEAMYWTALYVLPFLGLVLTTWGIALLLKERKMMKKGSYTPSAVLIASILFILFSFFSPHGVVFLARFGS